MTDTGSLLTFALLSFALIVVPGPSVTFVVSRAVALGRRAALLTVLGNAVGVFVQVLLVAAGLGAVVERSLTVFTAVKLLGAAYLVWLGVRAIRQRHVAADLEHTDDTARAIPHDGAVLREGFVVGITNPKAIVFFAAFLPQFVAPAGIPAPVQMAGLGLVFVAIALLSDGAWAIVAGTARDWFASSQGRMAALRGAGGLTMVGLGIGLAVSGRPE